jgi:hypothetical protein
MRLGIQFACVLLAVCLTRITSAAIYNGNGATGFGGPIGNGSLTITDDGAGNITITTNAAGGNLGGNNVAFYLDTKPGGVANTTGLTDEADGGRRLISGIYTNNPSNGGVTNRSTINFSPGFLADYGIALEPTVFEGVFDLSTPSNFGFVTGNVIPNNSPYTVTVTRAQLGLGPTDPFSIVGTLLSGSIFRSNETFGASITDAGANPGFNGSLTFTSPLVFVVPEPGSLTALGFGAAALLVRARRR